MPVGSYVVDGCETSPKDPAPCPHEVIFGRTEVILRGSVFPERRWAYRFVGTDGGRVTIAVQGETTELEQERDGRIRWRLHVISRVRALVLRRADAP